MTDFEALLRRLTEAKVDFLVAGGVAAIAHGGTRLTQDLDLVYSRTPENLRRLSEALLPLQPYLRGAPRGLPFHLDVHTLRRGLNFTLTTSLGDVDLLGEIVGGGGYADLAPSSVLLHAFGLPCRFLGLEALIRAKRAAGRPKDLETVAELEALLEEGTPPEA